MKPALMLSVALIFSVCPLVAGDAADGQAVYEKKCASCHGKDGKGDTTMGKKLKVEDLTAKICHLTDDKIQAAITQGVEVDGKMKMKPVKGLDDAQVQAVVAYVKTLKP